MEAFRELCRKCVAITAPEPKCLYYAFSFDGDDAYCREAYEDAEGLLTHLASVGSLLTEIFQIAELTRLEVHGPAEELAKLEGPLAPFAPTYFTLEFGVRRAG